MVKTDMMRACVRVRVRVACAVGVFGQHGCYETTILTILSGCARHVYVYCALAICTSRAFSPRRGVECRGTAAFRTDVALANR